MKNSKYKQNQRFALKIETFSDFKSFAYCNRFLLHRWYGIENKNFLEKNSLKRFLKTHNSSWRIHLIEAAYSNPKIRSSPTRIYSIKKNQISRINGKWKADVELWKYKNTWIVEVVVVVCWFSTISFLLVLLYFCLL